MLTVYECIKKTEEILGSNLLKQGNKQQNYVFR